MQENFDRNMARLEEIIEENKNSNIHAALLERYNSIMSRNDRTITMADFKAVNILLQKKKI